MTDPQPTQSGSTPVMVTKPAYDRLRAERDHLVNSLDVLVTAADWYRRCLEDVQDRRPVRGLDEAKVGYDKALEFVLKAMERAGKNDV